MRTLLRIVLVLLPSLLFATAVCLYFHKSRIAWDGEPEAAGEARLVVVISFDQFRGDYLERWQHLFGPDGFERMKRDGAWYSDAHLPYANTFTAPGHASLATGCPPAVHGIIGNEWYDRATRQTVFSVDSPQHDKIPGGRPGSGSFSPHRLLAPTIGDVLRAERPRNSKVFSLSIKDRTASLMGGKNPNGAYCFDNASGHFFTSSYYSDRLHPWVEEFNTRKVADRWFNAVWDRLLDPQVYIDSVGRDDQPGEPAGTMKVFPHPLKRGEKPGTAYYQTLETSPFGNDLLWELAKACIAAEKLGQGNGSHMLFLGFSSNDKIGHTWGPDSHEVMDATLRSDLLVAEILRHLDAAVGEGRYTVFISADHGVCPLPEVSAKVHPTAERFNPVAEIEDLGTELDANFGKLGTSTSAWFDELGFPEIYLNKAAIKAKGFPYEAVETFCAQWAGNRNRMLTAHTRTRLEGPEITEDAVARRAQLSYHPARSGDVFLVAKQWCLPVGRLSTGSTHGSPHRYDTHIPVLMFGAGIPAVQEQNEPVSSLILAPAVYQVLGLAPPAVLPEKVPDAIAKKPNPPESDHGR
jgi:predicted AlkP superfamily pyrophosphatase or phosphodiesterase